MFFGNAMQFFIQAGAVGLVAVYSFAMSFVMLKAIDATIGLRIEPEEETEGLDISQHGEGGYAM
jgi:Amt family ammonium transporter